MKKQYFKPVTEIEDTVDLLNSFMAGSPGGNGPSTSTKLNDVLKAGLPSSISGGNQGNPGGLNNNLDHLWEGDEDSFDEE